MTLIKDIQEYFGTKDLYEVLGAPKQSTHDQIKKCYRKASLKIHPDRVEENRKEEATKKFQVLAQVHFILSDEERRKLYDDHGIISNEDSLDSEADWENYWRLLFPKVTENDIQKYMDKYLNSHEEEQDLIKIYNRFQGDLDKISQTHIAYDEERTVDLINRLIDEGRLEKYRSFTDEPESKKSRRKRKALKEAKQAEKAKKDIDSKDLTAMIRGRMEKNFDSLLSNLEAKYCTKSPARKRKK